MEHMTRPFLATSGEFDWVPYTCSSTFIADPYDGGPFLEFPSRMHASWTRLVSTINARKAARNFVPSPLSASIQIEAFAQTWLFFGLLHEFLGDAYHAKDFVSTQSDTSMIDILGPPSSEQPKTWPIRPAAEKAQARIITSKLVALVGEWRASVYQSAETKLDQTIGSHLVACLDQALTFLEGVANAIRPSIRLSIATVIELFGTAMTSMVEYQVPVLDLERAYEKQTLEKQLISSGWCPKDISRFGSGGWKTSQTWYYMSHLDIRAPTRNHQECSARQCLLFQSSADKYATHRPECSGQCKPVTCPGDDLTRVLHSGKLPILRIWFGDDGAATPNIRLQERREGQPYVALSHIWADGLGNPDANTLPACQVLRLCNLVRSLYEQLQTEPVSEAFLWIDTLLCPSASYPEGKIAALARMKETYDEAQAVLVLDAGLEYIDSRSMDSMEICARVVTSAWMSRLWTYQEAALAKSLWVQFKDRARNFDTYLLEKPPTGLHDLQFWIKGELTEAWVRLRPRTIRNPEALALPGRYLRAMLEGMRHRNVGFASDEPLCLAALFAQATESIARLAPEEVPPEKRMIQFWSIFAPSGIPQWVVFLNRPKINIPGFRWAPVTFMLKDRSDDDFESFAPVKGAKYGELRPEGLKVLYPGCIFDISPRPWPPAALGCFWIEETEVLQIFRLRSESGQWYTLGAKHYDPDEIEYLRAVFDKDEPRLSLQNLALIWTESFEKSGSNTVTALLVKCTGDDQADDGIHYARVIQRVVLLRVSSTASLVYEAAHQSALALQEDTVSLLPTSVTGGALAIAIAELREKMSQAATTVSEKLSSSLRPLAEKEKVELCKEIERSYRGYVGRVTAEYEDEHCWCVD